MYLEMLDRKLKSYGWYNGKPNLLVLTLEGEFEGFYGRASESWEHRYTLEIGFINMDRFPFPGYKIVGKDCRETWEDLAKKAWEYLIDWENKKTVS